uniref:Acyl carrier protein n=1 Tax=Chlamydomonas leiostraca TaxID=1034604 RepID=A0A7S0X0D8_9CHLO
MLSALRTAVLQHLRLPAPSALQQQVIVPSISAVVIRGFAGGFLDKDKVTERVMYVAKHFEKVDPAKVSASAHFEKDLGLDSLDVVELVMALEEEFGVEIPDAEADKISSVTDAVNYMMSNPLAK